MFGGQGASVEEPGEIPLAQAKPEAQATGPCAKPAPASTFSLLEDFEDHDNQLFKVFQREGWWYTATDDTQGKVVPPKGEFAGVELEEADRADQNEYGAHLSAEGYTAWGVVWGTTLNWVDKGIKCPFNGSAFDGIRFRAKGTGTIRVNFGIPETVPKDNGGHCVGKCYDNYGKVVDLKPEWKVFTVRWDRLQQGGWGEQAPFSPERLLNLNFSADGKNLPVELWLDDIELFKKGEPTTPPAPSTQPPTTQPPSTAPSAEVK